MTLTKAERELLVRVLRAYEANDAEIPVGIALLERLRGAHAALSVDDDALHGRRDLAAGVLRLREVRPTRSQVIDENDQD